MGLGIEFSRSGNKARGNGWRRGQTMVEFAMTLPLLALVLFGSVQYPRAEALTVIGGRRGYSSIAH